MSPIGRTFIVLNLVLAATFVGFAGTFLQKQHNWKTEYQKVSDTYAQEKSQWASLERELKKDRTELTSAKGSLEQQLLTVNNELAQQNDEVKRLESRNAELAAGVSALKSVAEANRTTVAEAFQQAQASYQKSQEAAAAKDAAIRAQDAAEAENRGLKNQIAALEEIGRDKDLMVVALETEKGELDVLLDAARIKGFLDRMAIPPLAGTVSIVSGNLCTLAITDNPSNAEIKPGFTFGIYDGSGYKAEARVTSVDSSRKAAFCTFEIKNGDVKVGDKASTHFAGS